MKLLIFYVFFISLALTSPAFAVSWANILNISFGPERTSTMEIPTRVLRPQKGKTLRISVPLACGFTQILRLAFWGTQTDGQRISLLGQLSKTEESIEYRRFEYLLNNGVPVTVREIGIDLQVNNPEGCRLEFEQSIEATPPPPLLAGCGDWSSCPTYSDSTRYCVAHPRIGTAKTLSENAVSGENSCQTTVRLKRKLCEFKLSPDNFQISCY